jgi:tellurite resistance protein TerC
VDVPIWAWAAVIGAILAMLLFDLLVFHRNAHEVSAKEAAVSSAVWVSIGLAFGVLVWVVWGPTAGGEYYAGYLIEKSLSVDNIFVFAMLLAYFAIPAEKQHRLLFWGVLGALVFRAIFIAAGSALLETFSWSIYVFGAFLVLTGIRMARHQGNDVHPDHNPVVRLVRRVAPAASTFTVALIAIETTDVLFAVDSIPAIFAVTDEPFLVFTSNAFAILGLRALYFLLADMISRFTYLKVGLAAVLVFVGAKMLVAEWVHLPVAASLLVIATILATSVVASLRRQSSSDEGDPSTPAAAASAVASPAARSTTAAK